MEVVFIDAATKQPTERLQLKLGVPLSPQHSRIRSSQYGATNYRFVANAGYAAKR
jgi:hypothetical protein